MISSGEIVFPLTAIVLSAGAVETTVAATATVADDTITWEFASFGAGDVLYFDPTLKVISSGGDDDKVASGSPALVAFPLVAAASVIAALL